FLHEAHAGQRIWVDTIVREAVGKKLVLHHEMYGDGVSNGPLARCDQTLIHVSLTTRRSCEPEASVSQRMMQLAEQHAGLGIV
ncbi:MAG: carnitine 3-dehydrogenase, partial [Hyphomicrobiaceae bacterium]